MKYYSRAQEWEEICRTTPSIKDKVVIPMKASTKEKVKHVIRRVKAILPEGITVKCKIRNRELLEHEDLLQCALRHDQINIIEGSMSLGVDIDDNGSQAKTVVN